MAFKLSKRSLNNLVGVHPDLQAVVHLAIQFTKVDFAVTEGVRTKARQAELFAKGASKTMNSRHITGHAVDLVAFIGKDIRWDWPLYDKIAKAMKQASAELGVPIVWGGDWKSFKDGPHFELKRGSYP